MKIELSPMQMAVLAQVFARDDVVLGDKRQEQEERRVPDSIYVAILDQRINQSSKLRAAINAQLTAEDQRHIINVSEHAA